MSFNAVNITMRSASVVTCSSISSNSLAVTAYSLYSCALSNNGLPFYRAIHWPSCLSWQYSSSSKTRMASYGLVHGMRKVKAGLVFERKYASVAMKFWVRKLGMFVQFSICKLYTVYVETIYDITSETELCLARRIRLVSLKNWPWRSVIGEAWVLIFILYSY